MIDEYGEIIAKAKHVTAYRGVSLYSSMSPLQDRWDQVLLKKLGT